MRVLTGLFPQFHAIKATSVAFSINKILRGFDGMVDGFKRSDAVGTLILRGSVDDMVINRTHDFFFRHL